MLLIFFLASASSSLLELPARFKDFSAMGATATMVNTARTLPIPTRALNVVVGQRPSLPSGISAIPVIGPLFQIVDMVTTVISTCSLLKSAYDGAHYYFTTDQEDEK